MHNPLVCKDDMRIHQKHVWDWKKGVRDRNVCWTTKKHVAYCNENSKKREREGVGQQQQAKKYPPNKMILAWRAPHVLPHNRKVQYFVKLSTMLLEREKKESIEMDTPKKEYNNNTLSIVTKMLNFMQEKF